MNSHEIKAEALKNNPEIKEKVVAEVMRLLENGEAKTPEEALSVALKKVAGIDVSAEKLKAVTEDAPKMDLEELDAVAGGKIGHIDNLSPERVKYCQNYFKRTAQTGPLTFVSWLNTAIDGINFCIDGVNDMFGLE